MIYGTRAQARPAARTSALVRVTARNASVRRVLLPLNAVTTKQLPPDENAAAQRTHCWQSLHGSVCHMCAGCGDAKLLCSAVSQEHAWRARVQPALHDSSIRHRGGPHFGASCGAAPCTTSCAGATMPLRQRSSPRAGIQRIARSRRAWSTSVGVTTPMGSPSSPTTHRWCTPRRLNSARACAAKHAQRCR